MSEDNEENGEIALRIMASPAYTGARGVPLAGVFASLTEFCENLINRAPLTRDQLRRHEQNSASMHGGAHDDLFYPAREAAARLLPGIVRLVET